MRTLEEGVGSLISFLICKARSSKENPSNSPCSPFRRRPVVVLSPIFRRFATDQLSFYRRVLFVAEVGMWNEGVAFCLAGEIIECLGKVHNLKQV